MSKEIDANGFSHTSLIDLFSEAIIPEWGRAGVREMESELALIVETVGINETKTAFRDKLLSRNANAIEDTRYEIFATARACRALDRGSLRLEHPVPESRKNSDIFGTFHGQAVRIEVTVLHEDPPESIDCTFVEELEGTSIESGFSIKMRKPLKSEAELDAAKEMLRELHDHHVSCGGCDARIGDILFRWSAGSYASATGPFESVAFYPGDSPRGVVREVNHGCTVRTTAPKFLREEYPNPPGIIDACDLLEPKDPLSKRIRDMIEGKLRQCENGAINIVAFGNPRPQNERDLDDALYGAQIGVGSVSKDENGGQILSAVRLCRAPRSPFQRAELFDDCECEGFIDPFRPISGVWHIRLGNAPLSEMHLNPNASMPVPVELIDALVQKGRKS